MTLLDSKGALSKAAKDLFARWEDVRQVWADAQSQEFQKSYMDQIEQDVKAALSAMDQMNNTLMKIQSDCE